MGLMGNYGFRKKPLYGSICKLQGDLWSKVNSAISGLITLYRTKFNFHNIIRQRLRRN